MLDDEDDEDDGTDDESDYIPTDDASYEDYSSQAYRELEPAADLYDRRSRPPAPDYFSRAGERRALNHRDPIWGFVLPPTRPTDRGDRFPRPFRVHNDSRWSESFSSSPAPVIADARTIYNACAWVQTVHNRLLEAELDRLNGALSARELLNEVIYTRASLHQLFLILVTRYRVLAEQSSNPTLAANLQDLLLAPDDADGIYCPTTSFFQSAALPPRVCDIPRTSGPGAGPSSTSPPPRPSQPQRYTAVSRSPPPSSPSAAQCRSGRDRRPAAPR